MLGAELWFAYFWILAQPFRWSSITRRTFKDRLSTRYEKDLPPIDIFICTADPTKEPPLTVVNTVLSTLSFDYPADKLTCYLSDDGGSSLTFNALLECSRFAKSWVPFCKKYLIEPRSPEAYFSETLEPTDQDTSEWYNIKKMYEAMRGRINITTEMGTVPAEIQEEHNGFDEWKCSKFTPWDHPSITQILLENAKDLDVKGSYLPSLIYVSREKRSGYHHHYKAGALNVLIRVSAVMSNAPFILTLDCDMYVNNSQAIREAMCFLVDPDSGHQFGYVQFPQCFKGLTKNDLYANGLNRINEVELKGWDAIEGPCYTGTGCIHRREAICGFDQSQSDFNKSNLSDMILKAKDKISLSLMLQEAQTLASCTYEDNTDWGKNASGLIYGCASEDVLTGFIIQCRGWKSVYCNPQQKAFLGCAPTNCNDILIQMKRWATGLMEIFMSKYCPYVYGIGRTKISQRMCYSYYNLWALRPIPIICYGLLPALCMHNGLSLFPKASDPWFILFASLCVCAYSYSLMEFLWHGHTFKCWWNEDRMWMIKVSSFMFALIAVMCKLMGISNVGFEVTSKVIDNEAMKRYENEMFEFGVASPLFVPPTTLAVINLISLVGGIRAVIRDGYTVLECMFMQLLLASFIVAHSYPVFEAMVWRKDQGLMEIFMSKYCPYVYVLGRTKIAQRICYSYYNLWALRPIPMICYGLLPALCMHNGLSLFPKASDPWFILFASLCVLTSKVIDNEAMKRYENEMFEFGVASPLFVPPTTLAVINLISLAGGIRAVIRDGYTVLECIFMQLL
eukprot:Gb_14756 [translate_table: standard]